MTDRRIVRKRAFRRAGMVLLGGLLLTALGWAMIGAWALVCLVPAAWLASRILTQPAGVPILVYHSVSPDAQWLPWAANTSVRPEVLDAHLRELRRGGWTVVPTEALVEALRTRRPLPPRSAVIQFDDAYLDNHVFAAPILRRHAAPAMFFASTDFIAAGDGLRKAPAHEGYMNAAELRAMDADPLFSIEAHGTNHARIPVSERVQGQVGADWKRHAPLVWFDGADKSRWFEGSRPPALAPDMPLPEHDSALAGRWWRDGKAEDDAAFESRVLATLTDARERLAVVLGRAPKVMAWPFDRSDPISVAAAHRAGFVAVTGGRGGNRCGEGGTAPVVLSRIHLQDRAFGGGPLWLETLALRAKLGTAEGRLVWHPVVALANRLRKRRFGASGYRGMSS